jgi:hypothetical protein
MAEPCDVVVFLGSKVRWLPVPHEQSAQACRLFCRSRGQPTHVRGRARRYLRAEFLVQFRVSAPSADSAVSMTPPGSSHMLAYPSLFGIRCARRTRPSRTSAPTTTCASADQSMDIRQADVRSAASER